ncbi:MAG: CinA family protein [Chloroflexota bacterium]|nr:CinA family protein [Chloroflexota bacterium]
MPLTADAVAALAAKGLTLATAEATTAGLIGHLLTEIPGSSRLPRRHRTLRQRPQAGESASRLRCLPTRAPSAVKPPKRWPPPVASGRART